jgi:hypothetical protein
MNRLSGLPDQLDLILADVIKHTRAAHRFQPVCEVVAV